MSQPLMVMAKKLTCDGALCVFFFFHSLSVSVLHSDFVAVVCVCSEKQQMKANALKFYCI